MRLRLYPLALLVACAVLVPTIAAAGSPTGACYNFVGDVSAPILPGQPVGKGVFGAACVSDLTSEDCQTLFGGIAVWIEGEDCTELDTPFDDWDGSCSLDIDSGLGLFCYLVWVDPGQQVDAEFVCTDAGGEWFNDLFCGLGVPVTSRFGMAVLVLVLLAGSLAILSYRG